MQLGRVLVALTSAGLLVTTGLAQQPSMQDALANAVRSLGSCQTDLGGLRMIQADVIAGKLLDWNQIKQLIEAANPSLVLDLQTKKLTPKEAK